MTQYSIDSNSSNVTYLAHKFTELCDTNQILSDVTSKLELALVEAINNIIEHAYNNQSGHTIIATFTITSKSIVIKLVDQGTPPPAIMPPLPNEGLLPEGGWGLNLIHTLTDKYEIYSKEHQNISLLTKHLKPHHFKHTIS